MQLGPVYYISYTYKTPGTMFQFDVAGIILFAYMCITLYFDLGYTMYGITLTLERCTCQYYLRRTSSPGGINYTLGCSTHVQPVCVHVVRVRLYKYIKNAMRYTFPKYVHRNSNIHRK
jgi:hypothetical protein